MLSFAILKKNSISHFFAAVYFRHMIGFGITVLTGAIQGQHVCSKMVWA